jgi:hypothetical protein
MERNLWRSIGKAAAVAATMAALAAGCGGMPEDEDVETTTSAATSSAIKFVFVIAMENHDASQIIGNSTNAPYINGTLIPQYAHATNFNDELAISIPSEPHYVWMEAGTNAFSDHTFTGDGDPTSSNSTASTAHLTTQIKNATNGVTWRTYQEGINSTTGTCPIASSGFYAAKHNPVVFFRDVSGSTPSKTNTYCTNHTKALTALAGDLTNVAVASYNFITPNLCNDMHGASGCPNSNTIKSGDNWLAANMPALISFANAHAGAIFITWDEGSSTSKIPFIAVGPHVKANFAGTVSYTHSSIVKSVERVLELPTLSTVSSANDLSNLFATGFFP